MPAIGRGRLAGIMEIALADERSRAKLCSEAIGNAARARSEEVRASGGSWFDGVRHGVPAQGLARRVGLRGVAPPAVERRVRRQRGAFGPNHRGPGPGSHALHTCPLSGTAPGSGGRMIEAERTADVRLEGVVKSFASAVALSGVDVRLPAGRFSVLLGPSGCGKSTLLRLIAGLDQPTEGRIWQGETRIDTLPPKARNLSMVFQSYALFPHLTVAENILFGLAVRRVPRAEQARRLDRVAGMMGLSALLGRKPAELSGGQQQRVALARAVISERPVCLMDEPLSNLDAKLRTEMRAEIRALQERLGLTMVYVTHDQVEAMTMADLIVVMNAGRIEQVAAPRDLYARPQTLFVAGFIGTPPMNLIPRAALPELQVPPATATVGIRPEDMATDGPGYRVAARVVGLEYLGADQLVALNLNGARVILRLAGQAGPPGEILTLTLPADRLHVFDAGGRRIDADHPDTSSHRVLHQEILHDPLLPHESGNRGPDRGTVATRLGRRS